MTYTFRGLELPYHLKESIDAYVSDGRRTGDFLQACLENDLSRAVMLADECNSLALEAIVGYLYNECPTACWGSREAVRMWLEDKRLERTGQERCAEVGGAK